MAITAQQVNDLRKKTGAGMMDCKKALTEANGDMEKAIEILRKKGAAVAAKRAEKTANEGIIVTKISEDRRQGAIAEVNCETDFVAKNTDFIDLANEVIETVFKYEPKSVEEMYSNNHALKEKVTQVLGKIGEKIEVSRVATEKTGSGMLVDYIHMGSKLGVLMKFENVDNTSDELYTMGKDIAMQVAAMNPISVYREDIPKDTIDKEIEIYKELARKEGKPEQILEKIATGKLNKFYQENCLVEQAFIKDNSKTVGDLVKEFNNAHNENVKVALFYRFHLGDENK